jgi:hypothetical protein
LERKVEAMLKHGAILSALPGALLVSMVAGCGSGASVAADAPAAESRSPRLERSGSRLEVRGYEVDTIFVLDGFYDTKLGLMCVPGIASDGVERCVPRDVLPLGPYADGSDSGPDYADATCSTPVVTISKLTCADPVRVVVRSSGGVGGRDGASYWRIGAPISPAKICPSSFGKCSESAPDPAYDYFERGAPLPPTELVAFVRHDVSVSPALRAVVVEGEDGSRIQVERDFIDVARSEPCEIAVAEDGVLRCTPLSANSLSDRTFADASCVKRAAFGAVTCSRGLGKCDESTVSELIFVAASDACASDRHRFYTAGPAIVTGEVHFGSGPTECSAPIKQSSTIIEVGSRIEPAAFPPALPGNLARQSRLVERTLLVGDAPVKQAALFDPQIDDECRVEKAVDGKNRCLPAHAVGASRAFADAACTTPIFSADPCRPAPKLARVVEGSTCDPAVRIVAVAAATRAFERTADGTCLEAPLSPGELVAGDEVPPTTFVEATTSRR